MLRRTVTSLIFATTALSAGWASADPRASVYLVLPQTPTRSITVNGGPVTLPVISRTDATGKTATGASLSYSSPGANDSISVSIDTATDSGVTLSVAASTPTCTAPCTPGTAGAVTLSTTPQALVSGIGSVSDGATDLTYTITTSSAPVGEVSKTVTFTIAAA